RRCPTQRPPPLTPPHKGEGNAPSSWSERMRSAASFAAMACAAMLACNDHNGFAVIAHGPHCHHRADAVRGGARAGAAGGHDRAPPPYRLVQKPPPPPPPPPPPRRRRRPRTPA